MAIIKFEDGTTVNFQGNPSPQDINEVANKLKLHKVPLVPVTQPKTNLLQKTEKRGDSISSFLGIKKFAQGAASAIRVATGKTNQTGQQEYDLTQQAQKLIQEAKKYKTGSPQRIRLLKQAQNLGVAIPQSEIDPGTTLSNKEILGSAANVGLNILGTGELSDAGALGSQATKINDATKIFGEGSRMAKLGNSVVKGAAEGYAYDVAGKANQNKKGIFKPGAGTYIGGSIPIVSDLITNGSKALSNYLEKANLRLTPGQKSKLGSRLDSVVNFLADKKIVGSPQQRYDQATNLYEQTEKDLQSFLETNNTAKGIQVNKDDLISQLQKAKKVAMRDSSDAAVISKQYDSAIDNIKTQYRTNKIPISRLNTLKRDVYQNAYNGAGDKVLDWVEHDIGDVLRKNIETATDGLKVNGKTLSQFNEEYGKLIQGRKLLKTAIGRNQVGLIGRTLLSLLGAGISSHMGGGIITDVLAGGATEDIANRISTPARSLIGASSRKLGPSGAKIFTQLGKRVIIPGITNR